MSAKKTGYTFEQHEKLGKELYDMRNSLINITVDLSKSYYLKDKAATLANKAVHAIDELICSMDGLMFKEHNGKVDTDILLRTYYRSGRDDQK